MRLPRKGVLIRLAIYGPLLGYFGWQALEKWRAEQAATEQSAEPTVDEKLAPHKKWVTFPDGTKQAIYEMTPEEAAHVLGHELPAPGAEQAAPKPAEPNSEDREDGPAPDSD